MEHHTMEHGSAPHAATAHPARARPPVRLRELAPGTRLARWLAGRARLLWIDSPAGCLVMRAALFLGARPVLAWPGPVLRAGTRRRAVPLSWYEMRTAGNVRDTFMAALSNTLNENPRPDSRRVAALTHRVLRACAGTDARTPMSLASDPSRHTGTRVAIMDERFTTAHPFGHPGCTRALRFERMVSVALARHPDGPLWLVRSADPGRGPWLSRYVGIDSPRIRLLAAPTAFAQALRSVDHVYTLTASEGLLALIARVTVHVFGSPCYAGWGLTDDYYPLSGRHARPTHEALFEALFVSLPRYLDPETHEPGELDAVLASLELQRDLEGRFPGLRTVAAVGFERRARRRLEPFLKVGGGTARWVDEPWDVRAGECAALAGASSSAGLPPHAAHVRLADAPLPMCSQVIDYSGIYLDARRTCDLTSILNHGVYAPGELDRARALRERIVAADGARHASRRRAPRWQAPRDARVVLVAGQHSEDPTMLAGGGEIFTMHALLARVRQARPDAWLVYQPHPRERVSRRAALTAALYFADVVDTHSDLLSLIELADEIHTVAAAAGFDALLRDKPVFTYGTPFYAGWGLTHDAVRPILWRHRRISLDMLVAGALLRYPLYWDARLRCFTTAEAIVRGMACARAPGAWHRALPWRAP